jgi:2-phosphosulfolactate phosphatase
MSFADQSPFRGKHEWGVRGVHQATGRGDIVVIVDTLSFSTAVVAAVDGGALVHPCVRPEEAEVLAQRLGGEPAVRRQDVPRKGRFSLSPGTYHGITPGTCIMLPSPNGALCSRLAEDAPYLFAAALVNAAAAAAVIDALLAQTELDVTVVSAAERWSLAAQGEGPRVAIEDYLGAGAILSRLRHDQSPEARVCAASFRAVEADLAELIWDCASGRELREAGFDDDVRYAAQLDCSTSMPLLRGGAFGRFDIDSAR